MELALAAGPIPILVHERKIVMRQSRGTEFFTKGSMSAWSSASRSTTTQRRCLLGRLRRDALNHRSSYPSSSVVGEQLEQSSTTFSAEPRYAILYLAFGRSIHVHQWTSGNILRSGGRCRGTGGCSGGREKQWRGRYHPAAKRSVRSLYEAGALFTRTVQPDYRGWVPRFLWKSMRHCTANG